MSTVEQVPVDAPRRVHGPGPSGRPAPGGRWSAAADWRVLVVEDDEEVASIHRRIVDAQHGFQVVAAVSTGEEAHALLHRGVPFDLLLVNVDLPRASGIDLLRAMRRRTGPEVIALASTCDSATVHDAVHLGVVDYLVPPVAVDRLQEALLRFEDRMRTFGRHGDLDQVQIDALYADPERAPLPKNLQRETLALVRATLRGRGERFSSAEEVARGAALARVTARRYLEYLVSCGQAEMQTRPDGPGRPPKLYRVVTVARSRGPAASHRG